MTAPSPRRLAALCLALGTVAASCDDPILGDGTAPMVDVTIVPSRIGVGDTATVAVSVFGAGHGVVIGAPLTLSSSDTTVALLVEGKLVGLRPGVTVIQARQGPQADTASLEVR